MNTAGTQTELEEATRGKPAAASREPEKGAFVPEKDVPVALSPNSRGPLRTELVAQNI